MSEKLSVIVGIFIVLAIALSAVSLSFINSRLEKITAAVTLAEKENQPANIQLIKITDSSCKDCFSIDTIIESLKKANVKVTEEKSLEFSSGEAKQLIAQYNIEKIPTVIVLGEVNKSAVVNLWNENWQVEMKDGMQVSSVYSGLAPPYVDAATGAVKGLVSLTNIVDNSCDKCADFSQIISSLRQAGVKFSSEKTIDYTSVEAKELISKYGVQKVPAIIVSKDILEYEAIAQVWAQLNATEKQGYYALHAIAPPYRDLTTNKIEGLVSVIYLNDSSCTSCYNVQGNKQILERNFGLVLAKEETIDVSSDSGKALIKKYAITKVPIILVSPDANVYTRFVQVWPQVGDVASDNWFIMRNPEVIGTYKDLSTGQTVSPPPQQAG